MGKLETAEDVVRELHAGGMSIRAIASVAGRSPTTVMKILHEQGAQPDGKILLGTTVGLDGKVRPDRLYDTTERDNQIRELRASGKSLREIAAEVQCSVGTVHRILAGSFR